MDAKYCLAAIPPTNEVLRDLGMFAFATSYLLSPGGRHSSAVMELLRLIERLEDLDTEVQGMISSPRPATKLLHYELQRWSL